MRINIILPFATRRPGGGLRIMYEYANRLSLKGHDVAVFHAQKTSYLPYNLKTYLKDLFILARGWKKYWFPFLPKIRISIVPEIADEYIRNADVIISTWWSTALEVDKLSPDKGTRYNMIQDYESWLGHEDFIHESYKLKNTTNIVITSHLKKIVDEISNRNTALIFNATDSHKFGIDIPIEKRKPHTITMLYSAEPRKGSAYGLEALNIVKQKYPDLKVNLFSVFKMPPRLPKYITYFRNSKDIRYIYNSSAIYFTPSNTEGWGLPCVESMMCGCALICTNVEGHLEYAFDNDTALLVNPKNPKQMADRIMELIQNQEKRIQIAIKGNEYVKRFSWDAAILRMEEIIAVVKK
jgi:glycosyltransferase involved in cell wall biosynthesis